MTIAQQDSIDRGVVFLNNGQLSWGEFPCKRFANEMLSGEGCFDSSPFATTLVLYSLSFVSHAAIDVIRPRAIQFLLEEKEDPGVWRYWSSRKGTPIDPDLDDTCCASFALKQVGLNVDENIDCILGNRHGSGLFKTWLRDENADNDVDGAVNANVLLYLGEREETKAACDIVTSVILADREEAASWYYTSPLALYYMVSRAFFQGVKGFQACQDAVVEKTLIQLRNASDPMLIALGLCVLTNYEIRSREISLISGKLIGMQQKDGGWARMAFYRGPEPPEEHSVWWGSEELTTAFCVEALSRRMAP